MLVPICDALSIADVKREERDQFMFPKGLIITHLLADFDVAFLKNILEILDYDDGLITSVYHIMCNFPQNFKQILRHQSQITL